PASFTWTDARLQRNLVTLLTGQVVDAFDREFRTLYAASKPLRNSDFAPPPAEGAKWGAALPNGLSSPLRFVTTGALQPVALLASCFGGPLERPLAPSKSISLNHVVARRTLAPEAQSSGGGAGDEAPPPAGTGDARSSFKVSVSAWQRQRAGRGAPEAAPALSDILRNARRAKMAGAGTRAPAPKASKSMWDLSDLSQISGSGPSLGGSSAMDHLELGEDARSRLMKSQTTPAATLMRHRGAHKDDEMPSKSREPKSFYPPRPVTFATPLLSGQVRRANLMLPHPRPWASVNKSESAKPLDQ
ncbi:protein FAM83E-like, partial [Heptranchias perlo]|uniref:protein FAM83E-like n=1 Tax=Heptranchias perlo TaxID=212740 RepID=UPI00355A4AF4